MSDLPKFFVEITILLTHVLFEGCHIVFKFVSLLPGFLPVCLHRLPELAHLLFEASPIFLHLLLERRHLYGCLRTIREVFSDVAIRSAIISSRLLTRLSINGIFMVYLLTPLSTRFKDELLGGVRQEELVIPGASPWANIDVTHAPHPRDAVGYSDVAPTGLAARRKRKSMSSLWVKAPPR